MHEDPVRAGLVTLRQIGSGALLDGTSGIDPLVPIQRVQ